nr:immunoglobulin heavy chain junction region [Macaca mulatta]
CARLNTEFDYW